ncbi:MAG: FxLYD domain-containing protein [Candidatus Andersenbacteria bacterium]
MALLGFGKKKEDAATAERRRFDEREQRRLRAFESGFETHPEVEREYRRKRFMVQNERAIRAAIIVGVGGTILLVLAAVAFVIVSNLPGRDDDHDGVVNTEDRCPGFDDHKDADHDGVPDGCEEKPGSTTLAPSETLIVSSGQDRYDVALKIANPNPDWGASPLEYTITLLGKDGAAINSSQRYQAFLLPGQTKYLTAFNILAVTKPASARLDVTLATWQKVQNYTAPSFAVATVTYETPNQAGVMVRLKGKVTNRTTFTFNNVQVTILVHDASGAVIGLNRSEIDTLQPGEGRDFVVTFPNALAGASAATVSYESDVDVFKNTSFSQAVIVQGQRFQEFTPQPAP